MCRNRVPGASRKPGRLPRLEPFVLTWEGERVSPRSCSVPTWKGVCNPQVCVFDEQKLQKRLPNSRMQTPSRTSEFRNSHLCRTFTSKFPEKSKFPEVQWEEF
ncbi:hypothetical protein D623_10018812 [Myotis brandtii]|uniref:Uncharacterized protein n=1 Tax=Myotis brandtii TaxID=109478 RepID=S7P1U9_MYOBR|nr:hypothetical protein D623_10018812 [Myotis brandtii]